MQSYRVLNALPPEAFLNPASFVTPFDAQHVASGYAAKQYAKGLETGRAALKVGVSANGTWWAEMKDGGQLSSSEGIGYHVATSELWRGLLDGGAEVWVTRYIDGKLFSTRIK